jgi:hypothetical protein
VQLLSTNNELLAFIFDKMFKNTKKVRKNKGEIRSQADLIEALMDREIRDTSGGYEGQ